jgi:hypothetical protein
VKRLPRIEQKASAKTSISGQQAADNGDYLPYDFGIDTIAKACRLGKSV